MLNKPLGVVHLDHAVGVGGVLSFKLVSFSAVCTIGVVDCQVFRAMAGHAYSAIDVQSLTLSLAPLFLRKRSSYE